MIMPEHPPTGRLQEQMPMKKLVIPTMNVCYGLPLHQEFAFIGSRTMRLGAISDLNAYKWKARETLDEEEVVQRDDNLCVVERLPTNNIFMETKSMNVWRDNGDRRDHRE